MPNPQLSIEAEFKGGALNTGLDSLVKKEDQVDAGLKKITGEAKKADAELARFAKRTTEINATPLERYTGQVKKLDDALRRGVITQETHTRAVGRAKVAMEKAGHAQQAASGPDVLGQVQSLGAGWLSISAAVNLAAGELEHFKKRQDEAVRSLRSMTEQQTNLVQVATSQADLKQMTGRVDRAASRFGVKREEASALMFDARSLGFEKDFEEIASARYAIGDLRKVKDVAGLVPTLFDKQISPLQALNMAGQAAESSRLDLGTLAPVLGRAAEGATGQGTSADELFALTAMMSQKYASGSTAADRISGFQVKASLNDKLRGKGVIGAVQALKGMSESDRKGFLKDDKETNEFYSRMIEALPAAGGEVAKIRAAREATGTPGSWLSRKRNLAAGSKSIAADQELTRSEMLAEIAKEERLAVSGAGGQSGLNRYIAKMDAARHSNSEIRGAEFVGGFAQNLGFGETSTRLTAAAGGGAYTGITGKMFQGVMNFFAPAAQAQTEAAKAQTEAAQKLNAAADRLENATIAGRGRAFAGAARQPVQ